jgi:hypothetical protein
MPKNKGGMGVMDLKVMNQALLTKNGYNLKIHYGGKST